MAGLKTHAKMGGNPIFISTIPSEEWNRRVRRYAENWPLEVTAEDGSGWRHPWHHQIRWSQQPGRFECNILGGFVNEDEVEVRLDPLELPWESFLRIDESGEEFPARPAAWLSEDPWIPISAEKWTTSTALPPFFGENIRLEPGQQVRSVDVVLVIPKPFLTAQLAEENGTTVLQFDIRPAEGNPSLSIRSAFVPAESSTPTVEQLVGGFTDSAYEERHLSTIYLVSPGSAGPESAPDARWTPHVKHRIFYDVNFDVDQDITAIPEQQLVWNNTGLAGGIGDGIAQTILDQISTTLTEAQAYLNQSRITGHLWTV